MFTVYILYSYNFKKIYIGYTSNLLHRFHSHNKFATKGHTIKYRPWHVIYCEHFILKNDAMTKEKTMKSGKGREWIWENINQNLILKGYISA